MTTENKDALSIEIKRMSDQLHESFDRQYLLLFHLHSFYMLANYHMKKAYQGYLYDF